MNLQEDGWGDMKHVNLVLDRNRRGACECDKDSSGCLKYGRFLTS